MKKIPFVSVLLLLICVFTLFAACKKNDNRNENIIEKDVLYTLNGFENVEDLYQIKWSNLAYGTVGKMDINKDGAFVKEGQGSLKLEIVSCDIYPEIYMINENNDLLAKNITDLKSFSAWIYNANEEISTVKFNVLQTGGNAILSQSFELAAEQWTLCEMKVNAVVMRYASASITGFSMSFPLNDNGVVYIDQIGAMFGNEYTEEDERYIGSIERLIDEFDMLPAVAGLDDEEHLAALYEEYSTLPELYRSAVVNYYNFMDAMADIVYARNAEESKKSDAAEQRIAFFFDSFYGISEMKNAETSTNTFGFSSEIGYGEEGSVYIQYNGEVWNYTDLNTPVMLENYDYVSFYVYNDSTEKAIFWKNNSIGWQGRTNVKQGEWVKVELPISYFDPTGVQAIVTCSVNGGEASSTQGRLYFSQIRCYKLSENRMLVEALEGQRLRIESGNAQLSYVENKNTLNATGDGKVTLLFEKNVISVNVSQGFMFSFCAPKAMNLQFLDEEGNPVVSVSVAEGWNTVSLENHDYNESVKVAFDVINKEKYEFGSAYIVRKTDKTAAMLVMEREYLPSAESADGNDLPQIIDYLAICNGKTVSDLRTQFIKVSEEENKQLYEEQQQLYLDITAETECRAEQAKTLMSELIDRLYDDLSDTDGLYLFENAYMLYENTDLCAKLEEDTEQKAQSLSLFMESMPFRLINTASAYDRATFSIYTKYYPWTGSVTEDISLEKGSVMKLSVTALMEDVSGNINHVIEFQYDNTVEISDYDYVRFSVHSETEKQLFFSTVGWGSVKAKYILAAGSWTDIIVSKDAYQAAGYMLFTNVNTSAGADVLLFTDFYAYNAKSVDAEIQRLPEVSRITPEDRAAVDSARKAFSGLSLASQIKVSGVQKLESCEAKIAGLLIDALPTSDEIGVADMAQIAAAREYYNALTEGAKSTVWNIAELEALEAECSKKFGVLNDMSDLTGIAVGAWSPNNIKLGVGKDAVYGNYISMQWTNAVAAEQQGIFNYDPTAWDVSFDGFDSVVFYVYNGGTSERYFVVGAGADPTQWYEVAVAAGQWTEVEVPTNVFCASNRWGVRFANDNGDCEYKISAVYGKK